MIRWLAIGAIAAMMGLVNQCAQGATIFPSRYDSQIKAAVKKWCPSYPDWLEQKSQLWQESRLDPNAESSAGAVGVAQFTSPTWNDITRAMGTSASVSRTMAGPAIDSAAFYMERLRHSWLHVLRPIDDTQRIALSSYNAGIGSLLKAQQRCHGALMWADIMPCLPDVTGDSNAAQTRTYVVRIAQWRAMMH